MIFDKIGFEIFGEFFFLWKKIFSKKLKIFPEKSSEKIDLDLLRKKKSEKFLSHSSNPQKFRRCELCHSLKISEHFFFFDGVLRENFFE